MRKCLRYREFPAQPIQRGRVGGRGGISFVKELMRHNTRSWNFRLNQPGKGCRRTFREKKTADLRGHGQNDAPFSQYTMPELVEDIRTIA
jgi:hypothetical protein